VPQSQSAWRACSSRRIRIPTTRRLTAEHGAAEDFEALVKTLMKFDAVAKSKA
jgi:hypothetical protein